LTVKIPKTVESFHLSVEWPSSQWALNQWPWSANDIETGRHQPVCWER
jgi:hypothetical protein